jgi:hypothetical protein
VSARGPEEAILAECTVGVFIQAHLKNSHETSTNPKVNAENFNKANNSKEKEKLGLFHSDSVPEMNTNNLDNSPSFLPITHTILSA